MIAALRFGTERKCLVSPNREPLWDMGFYLITELDTEGWPIYNDLPAFFLSFVIPFSLVLLPSFYDKPHKVQPKRSFSMHIDECVFTPIVIILTGKCMY